MYYRLEIQIYGGTIMQRKGFNCFFSSYDSRASYNGVYMLILVVFEYNYHLIIIRQLCI